MRTKLILIRHGATNWNLEKRYCGRSDINLNSQGRAQGRLLLKRLRQEKIHKVYSSDRRRSIQTAKIVFKEMRIEKTPELREMHFGCLEGLTHREAIERYPKIYKRWLEDPFCEVIPGAEDLTAFKKRVVKAFKKIVALNKGKTIAVISHGGTIGIFITDILKSKDFWKFIPLAASLSIVEYKNGKLKVCLFNDTAHLS